MIAPSNANVAIRTYRNAISKEHQSGQATEHAYRPALKTLLETLGGAGAIAINDPKHVAAGAPDFAVLQNGVPLGHVECKDLGDNLNSTAETEQLKRYRDALPNLILTDYLQFRFYSEGELKLCAKLGDMDENGRILRNPNGTEQLTNLLGAFFNATTATVDNSLVLAQRMAAFARLLRDGITNILAEEGETGQFRAHLTAYRNLLIESLTPTEFADMQAQTFAYGLFAARCRHNRSDDNPFTRQTAIFAETTPFLRDVFLAIAGPAIHPNIAWIVDDLASLMDRADMDAILADFGSRNADHDPVVHFYEDFLHAYDRELRQMRGVYYTPTPVVSYIVRSVDSLLRTHFNLQDGLADSQTTLVERPDGSHVETHKVLILDPAAGTGTFLREVIGTVRSAISKQTAGAWPDYVSHHLLPRLFGFELLMAPYAICHLKLALEIASAGAGPTVPDGQRLNVFLTNALEEPHVPTSGQGLLMVNAIAQESASADEVKRDHPVMVILGNPPYSGHSANKGKWIRNLLRGKDGSESTGNYFQVDGAKLEEANPKWLNDDYVKFIRYAQRRIERTGEGILGFVTNHSYLDNPTFRGMRQSLLETFDEIYVLDLHGNAKKKEVAPDGSKDENVFDIQQGVAIALFVKNMDKSEKQARVYHADLFGERGPETGTGKYNWLAAEDVSTTEWTDLEPKSPHYLFVPRDETLAQEYEAGWSIPQIFPINSAGIVTARDKLTINWSPAGTMDVVKDFAALPVEQARSNYNLGQDVRDWKVKSAQDDLTQSGLDQQLIAPILYRPFDIRYTYYTGNSRGFICMPRRDVMRHMLAGENIGLITCRQQTQAGTDWSLCGVSKNIIESSAVSNKTREINYLFPLYNHPTTEQASVGQKPEPNINSAFIDAISSQLGLEYIPDGPSDLRQTLGPRDIFAYIYGVLHSAEYRERYADFLKSDFARVPLTTNVALFEELAALGYRLIDLHLLEHRPTKMPGYPVTGSNMVESVKYSPPNGDVSGRVHINKSQYFDGVSPGVWNCSIGSYKPADKWLKDRKGRTLGYDDIEHYRRICATLSTTLQVMDDIDQTINHHGGWPL